MQLLILEHLYLCIKEKMIYMEIDKIKKIEKNKGFKRSFFSKLVWRKYALVPPALVLFVSLFGVVYMYNTDRLLSYYCLPFIVLLLISTIWFKSTRKYLINQDVENSQDFVLCLVLPLFKERNKQFYLFNTGANRFNKFFLEKAKTDILEDKEQYDTVLRTLKKNTFVRLDDEDVCITSDLKLNKGFLAFKVKHDDSKFLAYYGESKIKAVSSKEIMSFL